MASDPALGNRIIVGARRKSTSVSACAKRHLVIQLYVIATTISNPADGRVAATYLPVDPPLILSGFCCGKQFCLLRINV